MENNTKNNVWKPFTAIFFSVIMIASIAVLIPVSAASSEVIIDDHFDEPELDITKFEVITTGIGSVSISAGVLGISSGYGGPGSALVKSREAFSLTTTSKITFEGIISAYCEGHWYPGVYGDKQPRGLRVGTDPNNAIEFISFARDTVEARTVASGVATTTRYVLPIGTKVLSEWVNYRIEATSSSVEFYVDGILIANHTTNIPTGPLNLYIGTSYSGYGNVPVSADWLYLAVTPTIIPATVDFHPDTLNKKSKGKWVTVYTELPAGYNVTDINISTMMLNETVPAELHPTEIGDYDSDGIPDLMVKFDRQAVIDILPVGDVANVTVTGKLYDGTPFEGTDMIRVIGKGKGK